MTTGYRRKKKTITLTFGEADGDLNGLEVVTRSLDLGTYLDLIGMGENDRNNVAEALKEFSTSLISWNLLEEDGTPVPATAEAVMREDHKAMLDVSSRWLDALHGKDKAAGPLDQTSPGGEQSLEASIPMETQSPNPQP